MLKKLLGAIVFSLLVSSTALAAPPPRVDGVLRVDQTSLHFGDTVTFTASVSTAVKYEFVRTRCFQNGELVWYAESQDLLPQYTYLKKHIGLEVAHNPGFTLGTRYRSLEGTATYWPGGAASCVADIFSFPYGGVVTSITYEVAA